uniref:Mitochondrial cytochrome c oxidase subunit VIc/VIIs domain-containing protein n=1 Tax=Globodera rostochiensis TaxID=31243 RepID=A0A914GTI4_GLORO
MGVSAVIAFSYYFFYVEVRRKAYMEFGKNYDPYQRMREICDYPIKYMHTCPSELAKRFEEKGLTVADRDYTIPLDDVVPETKKREFAHSNALERFLTR